MSRGAAIAIAFALAACWRDAEPTAPKPPPRSPCATAVSAMLDAMRDNMNPAARDRLQAAFVERCTDDGWPSSAIACLTGAKTPDDVRTCGELLTKEQRDRSERTVRAIDPTAGKSKRKLAEGVDPVLRITGIEPDHGAPAGGTYVKISGNRFTCGASGCARAVKVYFGARQGTVVRIASDSEIIVEAPGGRPNETVDVRVMFAPGGEIALPKAFTFVAPAGP